MLKPLLFIAVFLSCIARAHEPNQNVTISPFTQTHQEAAPRAATYFKNCPNCLSEANHYWCVASKSCYFYDGDEDNVLRKDCTKPTEYLNKMTTTVPLVNQFQNDLIMSCFTTYLPIVEATNSTGDYTIGTVNDCAYTFDEATGQKVYG